MTRYILAHDAGTTGNKATLYDDDGVLVGSMLATYGTTYRTIEPQAQIHDVYEEYYAIYRRLYTHTLAEQHALAKLGLRNPSL